MNNLLLSPIISLEITQLSHFWDLLMLKDLLFSDNAVVSQIENFSQTDASKCVNIVDKILDNSLFWTLYFDRSKSEDGAGAGCILINPQGEKTMLSCRLEF